MKTKLKLFAVIFALLCLAILWNPNKIFGTGTTEVTSLEELQEALADETVTGEIKLKNSIEINEDVTINGNGKTVTASFKKAFVLNTGKVIFNNIKIINSGAQGRCIDVRDGDVELTLTGVTLQTTGVSAYNQTLNIGGNFAEPIKIKLENTKIFTEDPGYGITTFNPVELSISNSEITGYAALYMKGINDSKGSAGSKVTINNSTLKGINKAPADPSNAFSTIVFEDHNIAVDINNSKLIAETTGQSSQIVIGENASLGDSEKPNKITVSGNSVLTAEKGLISMQNTNASVILNKGVSSNLDIPAKYLPEGMMVKNVNGSYVVTEIEVDIVVPQDKGENNKETIIEAVKSEETKETLNSSLKADSELFGKAEEAIKNGDDVTVEIKVEELKQDTIKAEEKQKITAAISEEGKVHQYFDISVLVAVNETEIGKLTELTDKVKLSMKLPKDLVQEGRKFFVLKLHDGEVEKIEATVNGENLEFETNEFSLYALAYEDVPVADEKDETPKMGALNISYIWVTLAVIALVGIVTTKKVSKHSK